MRCLACEHLGRPCPDTICQLRAENAKLRAALERVQELASQWADHWMIRDVAETALACDEGDKT